MKQDTRPVVLSHHVYRWLLVLYPAPFRNEYGRELALVFRDRCRSAFRRWGLRGVLHLWVPTLIDLITTALHERVEEGLPMSRTTFVRLSGVAAMAGSFILLLVWYYTFVSRRLFEETVLFPFLPFHAVGFALGIGGLYVLTKGTARLTKFGEGGLLLLMLSGAVMVLGLALMVWFDQGGGWFIWALSLLAHYAGLFLLGLSSVRRQLLPRWNPLPLVAGVLGLLAWAVGILSELEILFAVSLLILALHWLLLGLLLWLAPDDVMAHPGAA